MKSATDYENSEQTGLPAANVLVYALESGESVIVRPSGTEPKIKTYFTTRGENLNEAKERQQALENAVAPLLK